MHYYKISTRFKHSKRDLIFLNHSLKKKKHTLKTLFMMSMSLTSSPVPRDAPKACLIHVVRNECSITSFVKS